MFFTSDMDTCLCKEINVLITSDPSSRNKWLPATVHRLGRGVTAGGRGATDGDTSPSQPCIPCKEGHSKSLLLHSDPGRQENASAKTALTPGQMPPIRGRDKTCWPLLYMSSRSPRRAGSVWKAEVESLWGFVGKWMWGILNHMWMPDGVVTCGQGDPGQATCLHCQTPPSFSKRPCSPWFHPSSACSGWTGPWLAPAGPLRPMTYWVSPSHVRNLILLNRKVTALFIGSLWWAGNFIDALSLNPLNKMQEEGMIIPIPQVGKPRFREKPGWRLRLKFFLYSYISFASTDIHYVLATALGVGLVSSQPGGAHDPVELAFDLSLKLSVDKLTVCAGLTCSAPPMSYLLPAGTVWTSRTFSQRSPL